MPSRRVGPGSRAGDSPQSIQRSKWKGTVMRKVTPMEIGLMFWAEQTAASTLQHLASFGLHSGQLGVPPELDCKTALSDWSTSLNGSQLSLTSAVCCYQGEDYSNFETVHKTVGFTTEDL